MRTESNNLSKTFFLISKVNKLQNTSKNFKTQTICIQVLDTSTAYVTYSRARKTKAQARRQMLQTKFKPRTINQYHTQRQNGWQWLVEWCSKENHWLTSLLKEHICFVLWCSFIKELLKKRVTQRMTLCPLLLFTASSALCWHLLNWRWSITSHFSLCYFNSLWHLIVCAVSLCLATQCMSHVGQWLDWNESIWYLKGSCSC